MGLSAGLSHLEFYNYVVEERNLDIRLSKNSGTVLVEESVTLPPAPEGSTDTATPKPGSIWVGDFPYQTGRFRLQWSMDGGEQHEFTAAIQNNCSIIRVEVDSGAHVSVTREPSIDCYGSD